MIARQAALPLTLALVIAACGGASDPAKGTKADAKDAKADAKTEVIDTKRNDATSLDKAVQALDLSGPVPPEASAVFFTVDGALIPIGCYDSAKKKLAGGKDCLALVKADDEVYLRSNSVEKLDKAGAPKSAMCQPGEDKPTSLGIASVDAGETFDYAVFPKSMGKLINRTDPETYSEKGRVASEEEKRALTELVKPDAELQINQSVSFDVDGDGQADKLFSVYVVNPKDSERLSYSGVLMQRATAPGKWFPLLESRNDTETYTVRAFLDLDGDKSQEVWVNAVLTDGGGGDRIFKLKGDGAEPLAKWSCGI
ncbi:hypothetical protein [Nannocystis bainbridge]|uniref:Lipoprotein n=1 Tax=Nannocystis bainbridge TaxID=2995303 RepID=A0ABT5EB34_9BACT|nr:hypothetical protein [Nannocystis bainbridge]MDC0722133.1 hypothetical protein [Nannocystis bainbridge]